MTLTVNQRQDVLYREPPKESPNRTIILGLVSVVVLFGGLIIWAWAATISSAAVAPGVIIVEGNRKAVQHRDGGPVGAVLVREGDLVKKGQVLIRLDLSDVRAQVEVFANQRVQMQARLARLRAEASEQERLVFSQSLLDAAKSDPRFQSVLDQEQSLFETRRISYTGQVRLLKQQIEGLKRQIIGLRGQIQSKQDQLSSIDKERSDLQGLLEKGYVQRPRVLTLERTAQGLHGDLDALHANVATTQNEISRTELQIVQLEKTRNEEVATGISEAEAQLATVEPQLVAARERLARSDITAPEDGYIYNLAVFGTGAAIVPGEKLLEIVPVGQGFVIEAQLSTADIDRVRPGQLVEVHLLAYSQRWQSIINGTVIRVSADRFEDQFTKNVYYKVIVDIDPESVERNNVELGPGMPAQAVIRTGERTVLDFLLDPMFRIYDYSMKED